MSIIERSQRALALNRANSLKVAALLIINAAGWFSLEAAGVTDLSSPWLVATILPNALIYAAVRGGKLAWFGGMALPCLLTTSATVAFLLVLYSESFVPVALAYLVVGLLVAALGFLIFRMWTFAPNEGPPTRREG